MTGLEGVTGVGASSPTGDRFSQMSSEDFAKLIFTELSNQDPLAPNDTTALLQQLSTLRSIQSDMDLSTSLQTMVRQTQLSSAAGLIGRTVSGRSESGIAVTGKVSGVTSTTDGAVLELGQSGRMPINRLEKILSGAGQ